MPSIPLWVNLLCAFKLGGQLGKKLLTNIFLHRNIFLARNFLISRCSGKLRTSKYFSLLTAPRHCWAAQLQTSFQYAVLLSFEGYQSTFSLFWKNNRRYIHVLNYLLGNTFREEKTYNDIVNWVIQTFVIMSTLCRVFKVDGCVVWIKVCQLASSLLVKGLDHLCWVILWWI